jgi:uncharacterized lipoprotein
VEVVLVAEESKRQSRLQQAQKVMKDNNFSVAEYNTWISGKGKTFFF